VLDLPKNRYSINANMRQRSDAEYKMDTALINVIKPAAEMDAARIRSGRKGSNNINVCNKNSISPYRKKSISFSNVDLSVRYFMMK
jgi:hypothetical protein